MEERGEEGEGRDGSLHPLEFSTVGANAFQHTLVTPTMVVDARLHT